MLNWMKGLALIVSLMLLAACGGSGSSTQALNPQPDFYNWTGNTRLVVSSANGLLTNDSAGTAITAVDTATSLGGAVSVSPASGAFIYDPPAGAQNVDDTFSYTVSGGVAATVTIHLDERVWYVRNNDTGADQGSLLAPFLTLAQAESASDADDTIFVFQGDGTSTGQDQGITLLSGQRLFGKGVGLKISDVPVVDPFPSAVLSNAGLASPGVAPVVQLADRNEVAGFSLQVGFNEALLAVGGGGYHLHDNTVTFDPVNGREGIRLLSVSGDSVVIRNTITGAPRDGIRVGNNEDQAGNPVAATAVTATLAISDNTVTAPAQSGIVANLDGAGTQVTLNLLANRISSAAADDGIAVNVFGAAGVTTVASRNAISGSGDEALELTAAGTATLDAFVANGDLELSGGSSDFRAATLASGSATACLELIDNGNNGVSATFFVENNGVGTFSLFESGNDAAATQIGVVAPVAAGDCGVPLDGAALFAANCDVCHFGNGLGEEYRGIGVANANITNASLAQIDFQLINNPTMSFILLTPGEIAAISDALTSAP